MSMVKITDLDEAQHLTLEHLRRYMAEVGWKEKTPGRWMHDGRPRIFCIPEDCDLGMLIQDMAQLEKISVQQLMRAMAFPIPPPTTELLALADQAGSPLADALALALRYHLSTAQCYFCGHIGNQAAVAAHIEKCLEHPLGAARDPQGHALEIAIARQQNDRLVKVLEFARGAAHMVQHTHPGNCARCALEELL